MLDIGPIRFATRRPAGLAQNASTGLRLLSSQAMKAARSIDCLLVCIQFMWRSDTVFAALSVGAPGLPATAADQATAEAIVLCLVVRGPTTRTMRQQGVTMKHMLAAAALMFAAH